MLATCKHRPEQQRRQSAAPVCHNAGDAAKVFDAAEQPFDARMSIAIADQISKVIEHALKDLEYIETAKLLAYQPVFVGLDALGANTRAFENNNALRAPGGISQKVEREERDQRAGVAVVTGSPPIAVAGPVNSGPSGFSRTPARSRRYG